MGTEWVTLTLYVLFTISPAGNAVQVSQVFTTEQGCKIAESAQAGTVCAPVAVRSRPPRT